MLQYPKVLVSDEGRRVTVRNWYEENLVKKSFKLQRRLKESRKTRLYGESRLDWWRRVRREQDG